MKLVKEGEQVEAGESLSARRAWIETIAFPTTLGDVASLSARRAWIETGLRALRRRDAGVALRKEGVD